MFMAQHVESSVWCVNVRNNQLSCHQNQSAQIQVLKMSHTHTHNQAATLSSCKWPASVMVWKSHQSSLLVMLCAISYLWIVSGSVVLPSASVTELMGRWMKDVHEDGNTGHGSNLSAGRQNNFKDEDAPWKSPRLSRNGSRCPLGCVALGTSPGYLPSWWNLQNKVL